MQQQRTVLIVGATGFLGGKVAMEALDRGNRVRALVRAGTDPGHLREQGVEIVAGDMLDRRSLATAMAGCEAVIATAAGYTGRRKSDLTSDADTTGQRNLARAAKSVGVGRYVLCSVLTCDRAQAVPHFWNKKLAEDALEETGVPFVSLRPGAFLDQGPGDFWQAGISEGKLRFLANPAVKATFVHPDDVAYYLVGALDIETDNPALTIDIGADRPVSVNEIAEIMSRLLGRKVTASAPPWPIVSAALGVAGLFRPQLHDMKQMIAHFQSGTYVADTARQRAFFGTPPAIEDGVRKYLIDRGLLRRPG